MTTICLYTTSLSSQKVVFWCQLFISLFYMYWIIEPELLFSLKLFFRLELWFTRVTNRYKCIMSGNKRKCSCGPPFAIQLKTQSYRARRIFRFVLRCSSSRWPSFLSQLYLASVSSVCLWFIFTFCRYCTKVATVNVWGSISWLVGPLSDRGLWVHHTTIFCRNSLHLNSYMATNW